MSSDRIRWLLAPALLSLAIMDSPGEADALIKPDANDELTHVAKVIIEDCLGVKPGEIFLVVTDSVRAELARPVFEAAVARGVKASYIEMIPGRVNEEEPPEAVRDAMLAADAIVAITRSSITHTQAKIDFLKKGGRLITIPLGNKSNQYVLDVFKNGGMNVDVTRMSGNIDRLMKRLKGTRQARIITELGTDLTIDYSGHEFLGENGIVQKPGESTNLPAGELWVATNNANGNFIIDATISNIGRLLSPLELTFIDGRVMSISGEQAGELESMLVPPGDEARRIGEFGIGMNPAAKLCGILLEDEKVGNTVHIALGNNRDFGGNNDVGLHLDCLITNPMLFIDGERLDLKDYL